uniref:Predicted protein n=1 Tax=Hordeum vulgare subsp. vulgare TaxID=112509 RepID=F2EA96_HORVV|nr:predicted protein [Hordeum vulgare subsp. vulgare]
MRPSNGRSCAHPIMLTTPTHGVCPFLAKEEETPKSLVHPSMVFARSWQKKKRRGRGAHNAICCIFILFLFTDAWW